MNWKQIKSKKNSKTVNVLSFLAHCGMVKGTKLCGTYIPTSELSIFYAYMADNVLILMAAHVIISRPKKCRSTTTGFELCWENIYLITSDYTCQIQGVLSWVC